MIKQLPKGGMMFMRASPTCTYDLIMTDLIPSTWPIDFLLIDANTPVASPLLTTNVSNVNPNIVKVELEPEVAIETSDENLSTTTALVVMNPYEVEDFMRFTASVSCNGLSLRAYTLIDTSTSLNFGSKDFVIINCFYRDCKTIPKLSIRVASSEQRISTTKVFVLRFLPLLGMSSLTYILESYLTSKV